MLLGYNQKLFDNLKSLSKSFKVNNEIGFLSFNFDANNFDLIVEILKNSLSEPELFELDIGIIGYNNVLVSTHTQGETDIDDIYDKLRLDIIEEEIRKKLINNLTFEFNSSYLQSPINPLLTVRTVDNLKLICSYAAGFSIQPQNYNKKLLSFSENGIHKVNDVEFFKLITTLDEKSKDIINEYVAISIEKALLIENYNKMLENIFIDI